MSPVEFSTLLAGWCEKHHFSNQRAAAAELGTSYGTLCGWLSRVRGLPCRLTRAAALRRMRGACEPVAEASPSEVAAACKIWRSKNGLSQIQAGALLKWPPSMFRSIEGMTGRMTPLAVDEILHQIRQPVNAEELAVIKQRQRPVEPGGGRRAAAGVAACPPAQSQAGGRCAQSDGVRHHCADGLGVGVRADAAQTPACHS